MELFAVIMAGGVGTRFWPRSKQEKPKHLIRLLGENTLIQDTVNRLEGMIKKENILIITNRLQKPRIKEQLYNIPEANIIDEPFGKNTAACIGLASIIIKSRSKDAVSVVLPADHIIKDTGEFQRSIKKAAEFAYKTDGLVTIGITPTYAEKDYGYIQIDDEEPALEIFKAKNFAEKPNLATAQRFLEDGGFLWNSGMFVWKPGSILKEIREHLPDHYAGLKEIEETVDKPTFGVAVTQVYGQFKSISIDYGVLEQSDKVYVTKGQFDWSDLGSWEAVYELSPKDDEGNTTIGDVYMASTYNSYVFSPQKFTAVIGVEHLLVINTKDSLLICHRNNAHDVKHVVDHLKMNKKYGLI